MNNIKKLRIEKGIKSETMAKHLGISQGDYSKLETGKKGNISRFYPKIAEGLGIQLEELFKQDKGSNDQLIDMYERLVEQLIEKNALKDHIITLLQGEKNILEKKIAELSSLRNL